MTPAAYRIQTFHLPFIQWLENLLGQNFTWTKLTTISSPAYGETFRCQTLPVTVTPENRKGLGFYALAVKEYHIEVEAFPLQCDMAICYRVRLIYQHSSLVGLGSNGVTFEAVLTEDNKFMLGGDYAKHRHLQEMLCRL